MKIPTLLGITVIVTLMALSGLYYFYYQPSQGAGSGIEVSDLKVVNITDKSASIVWQTSTPSVGLVSYSQSEALSENASDNRDREVNKSRTVHFVTLNDLKPETTYKYKIKNGSDFYPQNTLEFKTAKALQDMDELSMSFPKPLKGTILNTNLNPIDESLVFLKIPGAQELATFSSTAGNFVLPLKTVFSEDLSKQFVVAPGTKTDLEVKKGVLTSDVKISISDGAVNLPPITIGSNLDLTNFETVPIGKITLESAPSGGLDFNNDSRINSLDLAILREAAKPNTLRGTDTQSRFDVNRDGQVNELDVDAFSEALSSN